MNPIVAILGLIIIALVAVGMLTFKMIFLYIALVIWIAGFIYIIYNIKTNNKKEGKTYESN